MNLTASAWLATALLLAGCTAPDLPATDINPSGDAFVYVIERGWHTDIGLPVDEINGPLATLERTFPGVRFLTFGFGERQFLLDRRTNPGTMLAALLPSRSALLTTALSTTPEAAFGEPHVVVLHVSRAGLERIEAKIWQELEPSVDGEPAILADGPYPGSVFYAARGTYDAFDTCNTWTAATLRAGGLPMPTAGVLFVGQVMGMARWIAGQQESIP
ncbi:MAG: DUF2459 domain-containing protein [Rhodopila sp.]|nr:DUF2459 domain-containing protein [Rhodopila sp.]